MAIVAFSLTSFANEIENKNVVEPVKEVAATELTNINKDDACFTVTIKWVDEVVGEPGANSIDDGITIIIRSFTFTLCL